MPAMAVFVLLSNHVSDTLESAIKAQFAGNFYKVNGTQWLVSAPMTARELSDKLGITENSHGSVAVFAISSYYGRHSVEMWDWLKVRFEAKNG